MISSSTNDDPAHEPPSNPSDTVDAHSTLERSLLKRPRIATVGLASWGRLLLVDHYPQPGGFATVRAEQSLTTDSTTTSAVALARLGADVSFVGMVGDDQEGATLRDTLAAEGVRTHWLATRQGHRTGATTIIATTSPPSQTRFWHQGIQIVRGDRLDIAAIFDHDAVLLDLADAPLRRFLTDLPAHTLPRTRLVGTLTHLVNADLPDALEVALRHDVLVGNEMEVRSLVKAPTLAEAAATVQAAMRGANLRALVVFRGVDGCHVSTRSETWEIPGLPVNPVDTAGASNAFTAGIVYGVARRWSWPETGRFANVVSALATRDSDAQLALPRLEEVQALLGTPSGRRNP